MTDDDRLSAEFIAEDGRVMTRRQIGYALWKRGAVVTPTDDGYLVDGDLFTPVENREHDADG